MTNRQTFTEADLQLAVYNHRRKYDVYPLIITNVYLWAWESDALYISKDGIPHEFEVKLSHSDFLADNRKSEKQAEIKAGRGPAQFWYVCPKDIISPEEVPSYAGLAYCLRQGWAYVTDRPEVLVLQIVKRAPRRRVPVLTDRQWQSIARKCAGRYWALRGKIADGKV